MSNQLRRIDQLKKFLKRKWVQLPLQVGSFTIAFTLGVAKILDIFIDKDSWLFYSIIGASVTLGLLIGYLIYLVTKENNQPEGLSLDLLLKERELKRLIQANIDGENNVFKLELLNWRISNEITKFKDIERDHFVLPIFPQYRYMRMVYSNLIRNLKDGDEYRTISTLAFWQDHTYLPLFDLSDAEAVSGHGGFLTDNERAIRNGAKIFRLVILNEQLFDSDCTDQQIINERSWLDKLMKSLGAVRFRLQPTTTEKQLDLNSIDLSAPMRFDNRFLILPLSDYKKINEDRVPFTIIKRDGRFQVGAYLENMSGGKKPPSIHIKFADDTQDFINRENDGWSFEKYERQFLAHYFSEQIIEFDQMIYIMQERKQRDLLGIEEIIKKARQMGQRSY